MHTHENNIIIAYYMERCAGELGYCREMFHGKYFDCLILLKMQFRFIRAVPSAIKDNY